MLAQAATRRDDVEAAKAALIARFGDRIVDRSAVLEQHAEDEAFHRSLPDLVFFPQDTQEVAEAVAICAGQRFPVTAWGAGTSLEGNALAVQGGLCLDLSAMNAVVEIRPQDFLATVQAGVLREQLNAELRHTGLFFPVDPGANATLGGMAATRASGTTAVKYGTMADNVVCCTVVLADGRIIRTAQKAAKSAAGYSLTSLMVGSEGTLGIITELTLRLHAVPEAAATIVCSFGDFSNAVDLVVLARQSNLGAARIEFLDAEMISAINKYQDSKFKAAPTLFVEFHGSNRQVRTLCSDFEALVLEYDGDIAATATTTEARASIWKARHNALYAMRAVRPGAKLLITDVCVPISRLAEAVLAARHDLDGSSLQGGIAGHVGDGNFHAFIVLDPAAANEIAEAQRLHHLMARRAIAAEGTCTGEHGIGIGKRDLLATELSEAVSVMQSIKVALDPLNLLNPGKIFS